MARYIDADKIDFSPLKDDFDRAMAKVIIMGQPTAEVAPKSEVARIFEELKKSVASKIPMKIRPIFEDDRNFEDGFREGKSDALIEVLVLIAELKKKHTEEVK